MEIMIAGGAGFIGSHLSEYLVSRGHRVTIVDDFSSGQISNLNLIRDKVDLIKSDITNIKIEKSFDVIVNLASRASRVEWETYPVDVALTNSVGTDRLIKLALECDAKYLFASTSEVYGNAEIVPTPETYVGRINPVGSRSPYDEGKRFAEALVKAYEAQYGLKAVIIRFFNTYGPRMRGGDLYGRVLDRFIQQSIAGVPLTIYGDGAQTRSFTHVSDSVKGIDLVIRKGVTGEIYNLGNDKEISILDVSEMVKKITGSKSPIEYRKLPPDDPKRRAADISKMRILGWEPTLDLHNGLESMVEYEKYK